MKKTLLLLCLLPVLTLAQEINIKNFSVRESIGRTFPTNSKFDLDFDIQGQYKRLDLYFYKNSINEENRIGYIAWYDDINDEIINYPNYEKKLTWFTSTNSYSTAPGQKYYMVVKYAGISKELSYTFQPLNIKNFKVLEQSGKTYPSNSKFDLEFDIQGKYKRLDLYFYKNSTDDDNMIGYIAWYDDINDEIINYPNYKKKLTWFTSTDSYSTAPGQKYYMVVKYANTNTTYSYKYPGGPDESTEQPDLTLTKFEIPSYGSTYPQLDLYSRYTAKVECKNTGKVSGNIISIELYLSKHTKFDDYYKELFSSVSISKKVEPNKTISIEIPVENFPLYWDGNSTNGIFSIFAKVNCKEKESTTSNNTTYQKVQIKSPYSAQLKSSTSITDMDNEYQQKKDIKIYPNPSNGAFNLQLGSAKFSKLSVFSYIGKQIYVESIKNKTDIKVDLPNPSAGIYYIELSNNDGRKVIKLLIE